MFSGGLVWIRPPVYDAVVSQDSSPLRALCVSRHEFVSEHIARFFGEHGIATEPVVGVEGAVEAAQRIAPDVILCEHELLTGFSITAWENDARLSSTAVISVSLSRRPNETVTYDLNGVAGFLYLPTLDVENALRLIHAAAASTRAQYNASPSKSLSASPSAH
jgi:DNA-binding NarL/FixJ family response regulator